MSTKINDYWATAPIMEPSGWKPKDEDALTPRTRFLLWLGLSHLASNLDMMLACWDERGRDIGGEYDHAVGLFPRSVRNQPLEWWQKMYAATRRIEEGVRSAVLWNPRNPAEEAAIHIVCRYGFYAHVKDLMIDDEPRLKAAYKALPNLGKNREKRFEEVLPALTGDDDVSFCWDASRDGIDHPTGDLNMFLGMGDYRPDAWFDLFLHAQEPAEDQRSFLH